MLNLFLRKKTISDSDFFKGFIDCHSHILPSVDDGVTEIEMSLKILSEYEQLGIRRVIFTPHIMEEFEKNDASFLRAEFEKFKSIYKGRIEISLAAEYMLDSQFETHLDNGNMLTLCNNYLLVETSYLSSPLNITASLQSIMAKGYYVVLAHPERYGYMEKRDFVQLKNMGVLFQLNLLSLSGYYGKQVEEIAKYMLDRNMYNTAGSDLHNLATFQRWIKKIRVTSKQLKALQKVNLNNYICAE